ncbi:MAG: hypothetical protein MUE91_07330 [Ignavibacteriaceae bacterium]|jgi:hypothetical protein|nr:hypothetical protein [Ignavibacteriaceae bacterium]
MTLDEMNGKTDMLHLLIPTVKQIVAEQLLCDEQLKMLDDFCCEILAYQDAENSFHNHIVFMENNDF